MAAINFPASPSNGDTHQGFVYNSTLGVWQSAGAQTAVTSFTGLSDTPSALGTAGQIAKVNSGATALEFADQSGVTVYATADLLPGTANAGDMAFVTATNRLYLWNGSGWYNIALINTNPTISGASSSYILATDGTPTVVTITATDPEGIPITYSIASDTSGNTATVTQGTGASSNVFTITPSTNTANEGTFSLTFRASDGVNIASAISEFTLAFIIQNSQYTSALITSVGGNNAVNNSFVDSSTNNHTITAYGNATQTTFSPYAISGYSTFFGSTGTQLSVAYNSTAFNLGTGNFTMEGWVRPNNNGTTQELMRAYPGAGTGNWILRIVSSGRISFYLYPSPNFGYWEPSGATFNWGEWNHFALTRDGNTWYAFINGALAGSITDSTALWIASNATLHIGANGNSGASPVDGEMSNLRIIKGTALYTSAFTPSTEPLTAITGTSLLTLQNNRFIDNSSYAHTINSVNNTAKIVSAKPFLRGIYSAADNGGSMYFDGSGDYLTVPSDASLSLDADFTLEYWVYISTSGVNNYFFTLGDSINASGLETYLGYSGSQFVIYSNDSIPLQSTTIPTPNTWSHVALVRSGSTVTLYLNGTSLGTFSSTQTFSGNIHIGAEYFNGAISGSGAATLNGTLSDLRIVKGTAVYTSNFTPPTAPLTAITNTSLLINGTNAGIIDKSQTVQTLTLNGDVKSSTTQSKYLSSSMYFDGTGDSLTFGTASDYVWLHNKTTDYTIEFWMYAPSDVTTRQCILETAATTTSSGIMVDITSGTARLNIYRSVSSSLTISQSSSASISTGQWHHVAFSVTTSDVKTFVDGTLEATTSWSLAGSSANSQGSLSIGGSELGSVTDFTGYLSDVRITKGLARYTANFTPPTAALQG